MHGLPHAVKDLTDVRGLPTTMGFRAVEEAPIAQHDEMFVEFLRAAGALFVGKTNTSEFGIGSHTYNAVAPTTGNARNSEVSAGGSSGGAAAAVALGMVPVADGSDFMGSLRNPPGWNGVIGLRPTPGLVAERGADPTYPGLGVNGPIARNVSDCAALLATMADNSELTDVEPAAREPQLGWLGDLGGYLPFESGVLDVCRSAVARWPGRAMDVRLPTLGSFSVVDQLWPTWLTLRHREVGGWLAGSFSEDEIASMKPEAQWEIEGFRSLTPRQLVHARSVQSDLHQAVLQLLDRCDALVLPTAQCWPFPAHLHWPSAVAGVPMETYHQWMEVTTLASLAGCPTLAVPAGVNEAGLPMGVQLIGRPDGEADLLALALRAEQEGALQVDLPTEVSR
jgi:amidase